MGLTFMFLAQVSSLAEPQACLSENITPSLGAGCSGDGQSLPKTLPEWKIDGGLEGSRWVDGWMDG